MVDVSLGIAFVAGLISFFAPCILPIIPGFLAYLGGASTESPSGKERLSVFINSVFFVLGFSSIFAILGVLLNTLLEAIAYDVQVWLARVGGVVIIFFGLYLARIIKVPFLDRDHKVQVKAKFSSRYLTSFVFGAAFAAGWTPCVGAALGAILGLAASTPGTAFALLMSYALGLGVPFLVVGLFAAQATSLFAKHAKLFARLNIAFGWILIALGILVFTQYLNVIASWGLLNSFLLK
jgi:cytochrome c-type biogenesis protein